MDTKKTYKRKLLNFSIKRDMQLKMIGKIFLLLFVSLLLSGLIFYYFANQEITSSFQMFHIKARNFLDFLLPVVIAAFFISLLAGAVGSLFFPKPIAGGLYRIEEELKLVVGSGDLRVQIKLRDGDQVTSLAEQINVLLTDLRGRVSGTQHVLAQLDQLCESGNPEELEKLRKIRDQLQVEIGELKV